MKRVIILLLAVFMLAGGSAVGAGDLVGVTERMTQIPSRPGIQNRVLIYRPDTPLATVILFPDGNGRLDISHVFNTPYLGRTDDIPTGFIHHMLRQNLTVVLVDAPSDHRSMLGINGWHGPGIFRLSNDHARDIGAVVDSLKQQDPLPVWLAGIRMGAFSAATAAIHLQNDITGLIIAGGITQCPEQKILLQLCPEGLMGMPLHAITVPTLILSDSNTFPEPMLAAALSQSPTIRYQMFPEFIDFESVGGRETGSAAIPGVSDTHLCRQITDFIRWQKMTNPVLLCDSAPGTLSSLEVYLVGCYY
jgi:hypothetical protein